VVRLRPDSPLAWSFHRSLIIAATGPPAVAPVSSWDFDDALLIRNCNSLRLL